MSNLIYPTSNLTQPPNLVIERGEGAYVYDQHGKPYLEGMSGLWCAGLGYGHPELVEAAASQMSQLSFAHLFGGKTHRVGLELAETLTDMVPVKNAKVFFGNSGSDANDTNIKLLRYYFSAIGKTNKTKIIARQRSYHGVTVAAASLTGLSVNHHNFNLPFEALGVLRTDAPHYYNGRLVGESESQFVERIVHNLEQLIIAEGPDTIAAFIAEPVTGASGVIVPPKDYYQKVQCVLNKYGILFWADEVITAFGRLGSDFGSNAMGIESPSVMTLAKQLSAGYIPISASIIEGEMYQEIVKASEKVGVFGHGYTYSGHPVACAVALKTLEVYKRDRIFDHANTMGMYLQTQLRTLADHPLVGEVRGKGMIGAIELVAKKHPYAAFMDAKVGTFAMMRCQEYGLITRLVAGSSLALCPPLIITKEEVDKIIEILNKALDDTLEFAHKYA